MKISGACAIVTGAGSGIGAATALRLAAAGARVVLAGRSRESLEAVAERVRAAGGTALVAVTDVVAPTQVRAMVEQAAAAFGTVDVLVNSAGLVRVGEVASFSVDDWDRIMAVNVRGVFLCCQAVLPLMERQGRGHIINLASVAAKVHVPSWSAYSASKAAVASFSLALLEEVRRKGIRVTVVYPGATDSPLWDTFPNDFDRSTMLTADDVAVGVVYALSQPASALVEEVSLMPQLGLQ